MDRPCYQNAWWTFAKENPQYGELQLGKRSHGGQKKRYNETLKASLKDLTYQQSQGNRLHKIVQSGEAS